MDSASVIVFSSVAAAQLFMSENNTAFAAENCGGTEELVCHGGEGRGGLTGGGGGLTTCTSDESTPFPDSTCTTRGEGGENCFNRDCDAEPSAGGGGGQTTCLSQDLTDDGVDNAITVCTQDTGGSGSKPQ